MTLRDTRGETLSETKDRRKTFLYGLGAIAAGLGLGVWAYIDWIRPYPGDAHIAPLLAPALLVVFGVYNVSNSRRQKPDES